MIMNGKQKFGSKQLHVEGAVWHSPGKSLVRTAGNTVRDPKLVPSEYRRDHVMEFTHNRVGKAYTILYDMDMCYTE